MYGRPSRLILLDSEPILLWDPPVLLLLEPETKRGRGPPWTPLRKIPGAGSVLLIPRAQGKRVSPCSSLHGTLDVRWVIFVMVGRCLTRALQCDILRGARFFNAAPQCRSRVGRARQGRTVQGDCENSTDRSISESDLSFFLTHGHHPMIKSCHLMYALDFSSTLNFHRVDR